VQYVRTTLGKCSGEGYALACEALAAADLRGLLGKIKAPTLIVCGDDDIPSFLDASRILSSSISQATLTWIPQARHASILERPDLGLRAIRQFLKTDGHSRPTITSKPRD